MVFSVFLDFESVSACFTCLSVEGDAMTRTGIKDGKTGYRLWDDYEVALLSARTREANPDMRIWYDRRLRYAMGDG